MVQCGDQIPALLCPTGSLRVKERLCAKGRVKGMQQFEYVREMSEIWDGIQNGNQFWMVGVYRDGEGSLEYDKSLKTHEQRSKVNFNF